MAETEVEFHPVVTLHKYFIWCVQMRTSFDRVLPRFTETTRWNDPVAIDMFMYMSHWYATLYVVIEGWRELRLNDPVIDGLLTSSNVKLLKLYRHGVYHFQRDYFDKRYLKFMDNPDSARWVRALHQGFYDYLELWFNTYDLHGIPKASY
jgi:hypothetical protein